MIRCHVVGLGFALQIQCMCLCMCVHAVAGRLFITCEGLKVPPACHNSVQVLVRVHIDLHCSVFLSLSVGSEALNFSLPASSPLSSSLFVSLSLSLSALASAPPGASTDTSKSPVIVMSFLLVTLRYLCSQSAPSWRKGVLLASSARKPTNPLQSVTL